MHPVCVWGVRACSAPPPPPRIQMRLAGVGPGPHLGLRVLRGPWVHPVPRASLHPELGALTGRARLLSGPLTANSISHSRRRRSSASTDTTP